VVEDTSYSLQLKCRPKNLFSSDISLMAILAGDHPKRALKLGTPLSALASENLTSNQPSLGNGVR